MPDDRKIIGNDVNETLALLRGASPEPAPVMVIIDDVVNDEPPLDEVEASVRDLIAANIIPGVDAREPEDGAWARGYSADSVDGAIQAIDTAIGALHSLLLATNVRMPESARSQILGATTYLHAFAELLKRGPVLAMLHPEEPFYVLRGGETLSAPVLQIIAALKDARGDGVESVSDVLRTSAGCAAWPWKAHGG